MLGHLLLFSPGDQNGVMPRFVLLYHDCPPDYVRPSHWDLMFEAGDVLWTWALRQLPREWAALQGRTVESYPNGAAIAAESSVTAEGLADHRLDYLELEGPLSSNRGSVTRIEAGEYTSESHTADRWQIALSGRVWSGRIVLQRAASDSAHWTLSILHPDG